MGNSLYKLTISIRFWKSLVFLIKYCKRLVKYIRRFVLIINKQIPVNTESEHKSTTFDRLGAGQYGNYTNIICTYINIIDTYRIVWRQ